MRIETSPPPLTLTSGEGRLVAHYTNRGEPYREGADVTLWLGEWDLGASVFLEESEAKELRDWLNRLYPPK